MQKNHQKMANLLSQKRMIKKLLEGHNKRRVEHGVPELELDQTLSDLAAEHAKYLSEHNILKHSNKKHPESDEALGENLLMVNLSDEEFENISGNELADIWYSDIKRLDRESPDRVLTVNNFTQMVWKSSKKVGFGFAVNDSEHLYLVGYYYPAGNIINEMKENILEWSNSDESGDENACDNSMPAAAAETSSKQEPKEEPKPEPKKEEQKPETPHERFIREALQAHNEYRAQHSASPLVHNPELSRVAQNYAQQLARRNCLQHSNCDWNGKRMGENLAMVMDSRLTHYSGK